MALSSTDTRFVCKGCYGYINTKTRTHHLQVGVDRVGKLQEALSWNLRPWLVHKSTADNTG